MKKILIGFFVVMGVLFCLVLIALAYFFVTDPYNLKPLFFGTGGESPYTSDTNNTTGTSGGSETDTASTTANQQPAATGGFTLSAAQKQALVNVGVDPAAVPSEISQEQEDCFVRALGSGRVVEIKSGAVPTPMEFLRAQSCI